MSEDAKKDLPTCSVCGKEAPMKCPKCLELKLPSTHFCGQECFKKAWKVHNNDVHKPVIKASKFKPPSFPYKGPLRPAYVTPMLEVPKHITKPDYHLTGVAIGEQKAKGSKIHIHTKEEIKIMRQACRIGRQVLDVAARTIGVGVTTDAIDRAVHKATIERNAYPSPLNYSFFPKSCCTSVNEVICHGIPDMRKLEDGDIVNVDISVYYKGFHADLNETYCVGTVDAKSKELIKTTYDSLMAAIAIAKPGVRFREFGDAITKTVKSHGFSVVKAYCGHGVGAQFHQAPNIPHYAKNKAIGTLKPGMIFTIEPMINIGNFGADLWPDDWTAVTKDGKRSAQFEHTMLVTERGVEVLTGHLKDSPKYFWEVDAEKEAAATEAAAPAPAAAE